MEKKIYTIGHSNHSMEEFISMLQSFGIKLLVDIRNYPGSKMFSHFNKEYLQAALRAVNISYLHLQELGGRRKPLSDSKNIAWRTAAFRGYADYMETPAFKTAIRQLQQLASKTCTAYMCAEALWWSCHRALVSDYLKYHGWKVVHITGPGKSEEHRYTSAARVINGQLSYGME
jgi:uncharacterized protein (DUF488 family)